MEGTNLEVGPPSPWLGFRPHCRKCGCGPLHGGEVLGWAHPEPVPSHGASSNTLPACRRPNLAVKRCDAYACKTQWEPDHGSTSEI